MLIVYSNTNNSDDHREGITVEDTGDGDGNGTDWTMVAVIAVVIILLIIVAWRFLS